MGSEKIRKKLKGLVVMVDFLLILRFNYKLTAFNKQQVFLKKGGGMKKTVEVVFSGLVAAFLVLTFAGIEVLIEMFILGVIIANLVCFSIAFFTKPDLKKIIFFRVMSADTVLIGGAIFWALYIMDDIFSCIQIVVLAIVALIACIGALWFFRKSVHIKNFGY